MNFPPFIKYVFCLFILTTTVASYSMNRNYKLNKENHTATFWETFRANLWENFFKNDGKNSNEYLFEEHRFEEHRKKKQTKWVKNR